MGSKDKNTKKEIKENGDIYRGNYVERTGVKKLSFFRIFKSFKYSFDGLKYAYTHEKSLLLHLVIMIIVVLLGFLLNATLTQWAIILVMGTFILVVELINTSIEATVDLVTGEYHPLAKIAKDTASAAEFVADIIAFCMWLFVFIPKIVTLFK